MRFTKPLLQLPISFCADTLAEEVRALPASAWMPHPQGFAGNDAVPLVSPGGELTDSAKGPMGPTEHLLRSPAIMSVMAALDAVWGRSRLMRLAPGSQVKPHIDVHYYWRTHIRIHIPVITNPMVRFSCGDESVHMRAGECWIFDSFQLHNVQNEGTASRVHLVLDTVGGDRLGELIGAAGRGVAPPAEPEKLGHDSSLLLKYERTNSPQVMSPWEIRCHVDYLAEHLEPAEGLERVMQRIERFVAAWQAAWAQFGPDADGPPVYHQLVAAARDDLMALAGTHVVLRNKVALTYAMHALIFSNAVARPQGDKLPNASTMSARQSVLSR